MATNNYSINYDDERFNQVEQEKQEALNNVNDTYNNMINQTDKYYQDQIDASNQYAEQQKQLQQENTDFIIDKIEQEKEKTEKDYIKEQKGAYVDWQKQSNQYGANAEQLAASGMQNTGYSESSQTSMYNQYQGRVATARESFNNAVVNYNNSIKEAQLANNSALAEIAYKALQTQLELSLQGFQYKNELINTQLQMKNETEDRYYARWQDVLSQMNQENQFAESIRQYEQNYKLQTEQFEEEKRQFQLSYDQQIKEFNESIRQFNEEIARLKKKDAEEYAMEIQRLELQKQQMEQAKKEADREYELKQKQMEQEQSNWEKEYALAKYSTYASNSPVYSDTTGESSQVNTAYYQGSLNPDTKYGTFATTDKNGVRYQPNNVGGNKLSKAGLTIENNGVTQNVWKTDDGKYYYWEGRQNKYISIPAKTVQSLKLMEKASNGGYGF